jgi:hypothetical protein
MPRISLLPRGKFCRLNVQTAGDLMSIEILLAKVDFSVSEGQFQECLAIMAVR